MKYEESINANMANMFNMAKGNKINTREKAIGQNAVNQELLNNSESINAKFKNKEIGFEEVSMFKSKVQQNRIVRNQANFYKKDD